MKNLIDKLVNQRESGLIRNTFYMLVITNIVLFFIFGVIPREIIVVGFMYLIASSICKCVESSTDRLIIILTAIRKDV